MSPLHAMGGRPPKDSSRRSFAHTHIGKVRLLNEDRYLEAPEHGLWAVADGMGGHDAGDVAATMTVRALAALCQSPTPLDTDAISRALRYANADIHAHMAQRGLRGGCTIAALWLSQAHAHIFWAGDSRVYRSRNGHLERLTRDHSVVQQLLDAGALSAEQAARHPQTNVITRALGVDEGVDIDLSTTDIRSGDRFLLCSDGITGELDDTQLAGFMREQPAEIMKMIMTAALAAGGRDNLTLIMVG